MSVSEIGVSRLAGQTITAGGASYRLAPLTVATLGELETWVMSKLPDPIKVARELAEGLPAEVATAILLEAYADVKAGARKLGSPEATKLLNSFEGFAQLLFFHGRTYNPTMQAADWEPVLLQMLAEDSEAIEAALAERNGGAVPDPKAPSSSASTDSPPTGETTSPSSASATAGLPSNSPA